MFKEAKIDGLNHRINRFEDLMLQRDLTQEEVKSYEILLNLRELRSRSKAEVVKKSIDPNAVLSAASGLAGILLILNFEKVDVITSKALGNVNRLFK